MRYTMTREYYVANYIPADAVKVKAKKCEAIAYLYEGSNGKPCAAVFLGKQAKPVWRFQFKDTKEREARIKREFEARQQRQEMKDARRAESREKGRGVEIGHILVSSWGYDQTNVDFYQVISLVGSTMAEVRKIGSHEKATGAMTAKAMPQLDQFIGPEHRVKIADGRCKIDGNFARIWSGRAVYTSSYA